MSNFQTCFRTAISAKGDWTRALGKKAGGPDPEAAVLDRGPLGLEGLRLVPVAIREGPALEHLRAIDGDPRSGLFEFCVNPFTPVLRQCLTVASNAVPRKTTRSCKEGACKKKKNENQ